jgi:flagellar hook-length control protein FliK
MSGQAASPAGPGTPQASAGTGNAAGLFQLLLGSALQPAPAIAGAASTGLEGLDGAPLGAETSPTGMPLPANANGPAVPTGFVIPAPQMAAATPPALAVPVETGDIAAAAASPAQPPVPMPVPSAGIPVPPVLGAEAGMTSSVATEMPGTPAPLSTSDTATAEDTLADNTDILPEQAGVESPAAPLLPAGPGDLPNAQAAVLVAVAPVVIAPGVVTQFDPIAEGEEAAALQVAAASATASAALAAPKPAPASRQTHSAPPASRQETARAADAAAAESVVETNEVAPKSPQPGSADPPVVNVANDAAPYAGSSRNANNAEPPVSAGAALPSAAETLEAPSGSITAIAEAGQPGTPLPAQPSIERSSLRQLSSESAPATPEAVTTQVTVQMAHAIRTGESRIDVALNPAELGRVEIRLDVASDGTTTAHIVAERSDTLDLLKRDASALERALQDSGLRTESGGLSFNLRGDGQRGQQQQAAAFAAGRFTSMAGDEETPVILRRYAWQSDTGIDIKV